MSAGRETWAESYSGIKGISPCSSTHSQAVLICRAIDVGLCAGRFKYSATVVLSGRAVTWPSVICQSVAAGGILTPAVMPYLPQEQPSRRPERVRFAENTPVVLRFPDGRRFSGELQVISVTGGLLSLSPSLQQGSVVKLMFLARTGTVLASAQMLSPIAWDKQPFRFVTLHEDDQSRLRAAIDMSLQQARREAEERSREREKLEKFSAW